MTQDRPTDLVLFIGEKNVSSWSMRAWVALTHKALPFEERTISLVEDRDRARRRTVGPTGRVPVLHHGSLVIPDSLAILEYVEETFPSPAERSLWPRERVPRARARWLAATMHSSYPKLRESMSFNLCFLPERPVPSTEAVHEAREVVDLWETSLGQRTLPGPFLVGPFTGADVMFAPVVWRFTAFDVPVSEAASAYMKAVLDHDAVKAWMDPARALPPVAEE